MEFFKEKLLSLSIEDTEANIRTDFIAAPAGNTFFGVNRLAGIGSR
jgi:hypothetical protein